MDYVPVYEDETWGAAAAVPGLATVDIDPARQQLIGLKTTQGEMGSQWVGPGARSVGVAIDETRVRSYQPENLACSSSSST